MKYVFVSEKGTNKSQKIFDTKDAAIDACSKDWGRLTEEEKNNYTSHMVVTIENNLLENCDGNYKSAFYDNKQPFLLQYTSGLDDEWINIGEYPTLEDAKEAIEWLIKSDLKYGPRGKGESYRVADLTKKIVFSECHDIELNQIQRLILSYCNENGKSVADFGRDFEIPYRTVKNWADGARTCPDYVVNLIESAIKKQKIIKEVEK